MLLEASRGRSPGAAFLAISMLSHTAAPGSSTPIWYSESPSLARTTAARILQGLRADPALVHQTLQRLLTVTEKAVHSHAASRLGGLDRATWTNLKEMTVANAGVQERIALGEHQRQGERGARFPHLAVEPLPEDLPVGVADCGEGVAAPGFRRHTAGFHPLGRGVGEQMLENHLGGLEAAVSIRQGHQDARGADGEEHRVLVGIGVNVCLLRTSHGDGDGGRTLRDRIGRTDLQVLAPAKQCGSHLFPASPALPRRRFAAKRQIWVSCWRASVSR